VIVFVGVGVLFCVYVTVCLRVEVFLCVLLCSCCCL